MNELPPELLFRIGVLLPHTTDVLRWSQCSRLLKGVLDTSALFRARLWDPNVPATLPGTGEDVAYQNMYWKKLDLLHFTLQ